MNSAWTHKGYKATVEYDADFSLFCGSVADMYDGVYFESKSLEDVDLAFHEAVDDYMAFCDEKGKIPGPQ